MKKLKINTIDTHTGGEPARIVIGGLPEVMGETMPQKLEYLQKNLDHVRRGLMREPRGHPNMFGAVLLPPTVEKADFGIVYMCGDCYENMCGHGTIGFCVAAIETGMVEATEPITDIYIDTPAGLIHTYSEVENGLVKKVSFRNIPAFLYKKDVVLEVSGLGRIRFDISYGGNFYAIVKAADLDVEIETNNAGLIVERAMKLKRAIEREVEIQHPVLTHITYLEGVQVIGPPKSENADSQCCVVFGDGMIDRSPCGTGTSSRLALLHACGELGIGEPFVYESIVRSQFIGTILEETKVGTYNGIIPQISGTAFITSKSEFYFDERDPLRDGFVLR